MTDLRLWLDPNNGARLTAPRSSRMSLMLGRLPQTRPFLVIPARRGLEWRHFSCQRSLPLSSSSMSLLPGASDGDQCGVSGAPVTPTPACPICCGNSTSRLIRPWPPANYGFAIDPVAYACPYNISGNGESYYIAFLDETMQGFSSGYPNDSSDGFIEDFFTDGTICDQYTSP